MPPVHLTLLDFILLELVKGSNNAAPHYASFSILLKLLLSCLPRSQRKKVSLNHRRLYQATRCHIQEYNKVAFIYTLP